VLRTPPIVVLLTALAGLGLGACSKDTGSSSGANASSSTSTTAGKGSGTKAVLTASDYAFTPTTVTVDATATSITVRNAGAVGHNLTVEGLSIDSALPAGRTTTIPVTAKAGTYAFFCAIHPGSMKGTIEIP
jgi:plastocyanin